MDTFQLAMKMVSAGNALIVYGHTPTSEVIEKNHTYCIDTGCVFGGKLTAFRYPERELVSIDAHKQYAVPARALKGFDLISIGPRATQRPPPRRSSEIK